MSTSLLYYPTSQSIKTAVTLMVHGLNVQPAAMKALINWLNAEGSDVYLIQLSGHYKSGISIKDATAAIWQHEMEDGYLQSSKAAAAQNLPFYFLGYSLGALLGQSMLVLNQDNPAFDKQVLLAPATAIRNRSYAIRLLFFLGKKFQIPSYTPTLYRFNKRLPLSIYHLLFSEAEKMRQAEGTKYTIPTLIIIDPKDELISYKKLLQSIAEKHLSNYSILRLNSDLSGRVSPYHHLIIDEASMGTSNWEKATREMKAFLFEK